MIKGVLLIVFSMNIDIEIVNILIEDNEFHWIINPYVDISKIKVAKYMLFWINPYPLHYFILTA